MGQRVSPEDVATDDEYQDEVSIAAGRSNVTFFGHEEMVLFLVEPQSTKTSSPRRWRSPAAVRSVRGHLTPVGKLYLTTIDRDDHVLWRPHHEAASLPKLALLHIQLTRRRCF